MTLHSSLGTTKVSIFIRSISKKFSNREMEKFSELEESVWFRKLRKKEMRRCIVSIQVFLLLALPMTAFFQDRAKDGNPRLVVTLLFFTLAVMLYVGYFQLRTSIRLIADAPNEFLDERQIKLRNENYLHSYRILAAILVTGGLPLMVFLEAGVNFAEHLGFASGLFVSLLMLIAVLPTMTLAWKEEEV